MRRDRLISVFVILASVTVATIVVWLVFFRPIHERTTIREKPRTTVLVEPSLTPLRDSIRESKTSEKKREARTSTLPSRVSPSSAGTSGRTVRPPSPLTTKSPTRRSPKTAPDRRRPNTGQDQGQGGQASQPSSQPPQSQPERPPLDVQAPLPGSACVKGVGGLNC